MKMPFSVRPYRPEDALSLVDIFVRAINDLGPKDYSSEQVTAWAALAPTAEAFHQKMSDGRTTLVAAGVDDRPVAFCDLEADGHIDLFYCHPSAAGKGATTPLYHAIEDRARSQNQRRLYTEASEAAQRFFLRQGFSNLGRRDFTIGDVAIHNYAMEKTLAI